MYRIAGHERCGGHWAGVRGGVEKVGGGVGWRGLVVVRSYGLCSGVSLPLPRLY